MTSPIDMLSETLCEKLDEHSAPVCVILYTLICINYKQYFFMKF